MVKLFFEKIYSVDRVKEPVFIGIPLKKGLLHNADLAVIKDDTGAAVPSQSKATALWNDGSIKWIFTRFNADIAANSSAQYWLDISNNTVISFPKMQSDSKVIDTGRIKLQLSYEKNKLFDSVEYNGTKYGSDYISIPLLCDGSGNTYDYITNNWEIVETGAVCTVARAYGCHLLNDSCVYKTEITLTAFADKPYFEIAYRIINTTPNVLEINSLSFRHNADSPGKTRLASGISNYRTKFDISQDSREIYTQITADDLIYEANEHNAEVFYGTFFGDYTDEKSGIALMIHQAQQNFPKAVGIDSKGLTAYIVPKDGNIIMQPGMAREQKLLVYPHLPFEELSKINSDSIIYQMPDRPMVSAEVFRAAELYKGIYTDNPVNKMEMFLMSKADNHSRCYGMMNWGDSPDMGYTAQGRGHGRLVWTNNEYDFPHAAALMYARTGIRRFLEYNFVSARHQMDVDVCHYSSNPLHYGGQWEHTAGHCVNGSIVCSHQWVEGLLDYYHFTGDKTALDTAIGIGENILRLLETPVFQQSGQMNARETGWAMRSLTALYTETNDEKWLEKCDWIVGHFEDWEREFGLWLSPYTDNTAIRVVFMIAVAIGSLMRYYRIRPQQKIKDMILRAVDDLIENAMLDNGLFYYKELPSLKRFGNNPIILEALAIAYELTGNKMYLEKGLATLDYVQAFHANMPGGGKKIIEDTLQCGNSGTKSFAQLMIPVTTFYIAAAKEGLIK